MIDQCPSCEVVLSYEKDGTAYSRIIGIQVPGFYDGIAMWLCPECGHHWARDFGPFTRRQEIADRLARQANEGHPV